MSTPTIVETSSTLADIIATVGSRRPMADIISTDTTNALEIGFQSEIPSEMPLMKTNRNTSTIASST